MSELHVQVTPKVYSNVIVGISLRRLRWFIILFGLILAVAVLNNILMHPREIDWMAYSVPGVILLLLVGSPYLQARQSWRSHPTISERAKYVVSDSGLTIEGESYNGFQEWSNFSGMKSLRDAVVLFFTENQIYIIPNDSFADSHQREQIVDFVRERLPAEHQGSSKSAKVKLFLFVFAVWSAIIAGVFLYMTLSKK